MTEKSPRIRQGTRGRRRAYQSDGFQITAYTFGSFLTGRGTEIGIELFRSEGGIGQTERDVVLTRGLAAFDPNTPYVDVGLTRYAGFMCVHDE